MDSMPVTDRFAIMHMLRDFQCSATGWMATYFGTSAAASGTLCRVQNVGRDAHKSRKSSVQVMPDNWKL